MLIYPKSFLGLFQKQGGYRTGWSSCAALFQTKQLWHLITGMTKICTPKQGQQLGCCQLCRWCQSVLPLLGTATLLCLPPGHSPGHGHPDLPASAQILEEALCTNCGSVPGPWEAREHIWVLNYDLQVVQCYGMKTHFFYFDLISFS